MGSSSSKSSSSSTSRQSASTPSQPRPTFNRIADNFNNLADVQSALRREGLESSQLIVAVDYTKSNEWTGKHSCGGRSLHFLSETELNPYQRVIGIIARTLGAFDDDNLIPCYGFGDSSTGDRRVFSFKDGDQPCNGLEEVEYMYRALTPNVKLAGPTSFAPAIYQAMKLVAESGNQYHILLLVADGQVTRSSGQAYGTHSPQEAATIDAIVQASAYPLSIVMIGVGDGPWDMMREFDDQLPQRRFDNFQFVNATQVMQRFGANDMQRMEATFARDALMEIPEQYKAIQGMGMIGRDQPLRHNIAPPCPPPRPRMAPLPPQSLGLPPAASFKPGYEHPQAHGNSSYPRISSSSGGLPDGGDRTSGGSASQWANVGPSATQERASGERVSYSDGRPSQRAETLFMCPITQELMHDPVLAADGYTYERAAVERWLSTKNTSPMTNAPLPHHNLTPNHNLRSSIMEYRQNNGLAI